MSDHDPIRDAAVRGLDPVMDQAPEHPDWESLQFEEPRSTPAVGRWWAFGVAAALVLIVGAGVLFVSGSRGTDSDHAATETAARDEAEPAGDPVLSSHSIAGRWVLDSYERNGEKMFVDPREIGGTPRIEFHESFAGQRDTFASADGQGTAGTFTGYTGCNSINPGFDIEYEFSAGFLMIKGDTVVTNAGCEGPAGDVEEALMAMLWNTPDGIEVIMGPDSMEWYGSNLHGTVYPLTFRRGPTEPEPERPSTDGGILMGVFDVDGVEVVTATHVGLPDRADTVAFTTTFIDSGSGPTMCLGAVLSSLPPSCGGPIAEGLNLEGWTEEANGVRWGDRTVVVTWPPVDDTVQVLMDSEPVDDWSDAFTYTPGERPAECADIEHFVDIGSIHDYERSLGDRSGDVFLTNDGVLVLQVVGDPQEHRDNLDDAGREACVIEVSRNKAEQQRIIDLVVPHMGDLGMYSVSSGPGGRVEVNVPVADRETADAIAALVDDRTALRVVGWGILMPQG
ncbi:MAG: hypothetical protein ABFS21_12045 [Actinomycetota bacterium]